MNIIKYKYKVGDRVYYYNKTKEFSEEICVVCEGEKMLYRKDQSVVQCPKCEGKGILFSETKKTIEIVENDIIDRISIDIFDEEIDITYYLENSLYEVEEYKLFSNEKKVKDKYFNK